MRRRVPGTLRSRGGAGGNECASERECERVRSLGGVDRHVGGAGGARQPSRPLLGFRASPLQQLPPRPARLRLPAPTARRLYRWSSAAPSSSHPCRPLAIAPFYPPYPAVRSDYRGEYRGEPFGEPRNPRLPPRRQPRAGDVRAPLSSSRRTALLAAFLPCLGSGNPVYTPKRYFL